jgi:hypothetical protein
VYIIKASELTEDEQKRFIIVDNVGYGEWDMEMLAKKKTQQGNKNLAYKIRWAS